MEEHEEEISRDPELDLCFPMYDVKHLSIIRKETSKEQGFVEQPFTQELADESEFEPRQDTNVGNSQQDQNYGFMRSSTQNFEEFRFEEIPFDLDNDHAFEHVQSPLGGSGNFLRRETEMSFNLSHFSPSDFVNPQEPEGEIAQEDAGFPEAGFIRPGFQIAAEEESNPHQSLFTPQTPLIPTTSDSSHYFSGFEGGREQSNMLGKQPIIDFDRDDTFDLCPEETGEALVNKKLKMT